MIICSCNVLSDRDVRSVARRDADLQSPGQVHACFGCRVQCGQCAGAIRRILKETVHDTASYTLLDNWTATPLASSLTG